MDFDEYEYLENTVENPEAKSAKEKLNGDLNDTEEKERKRSSRHKGNGYDDEMDHRTKRSKSGDDLREHDKERRSRRHSSSKDKEYSERDAHKSSRDHRDKVKERDRDNDKEERSRKEGDREERSRKEGDREERSRKEGDREGRSRKEGDKDREDWGRKEGDKDRDEMSRKNREKDREERSRKEGDSDRDNDGKKEHDIVRKERGNEVERDADREKDRSRRSRSHLGRPHVEQEGEKSREREKSRDRELVEREKEREFRTREREGNRRYKDKKEDRVEPEADPERDQRTVFAYQISLKADDRDVYEFFSRVGKVRDVRLIMDRITKRSKGVGYVEFYDSMSVPMAIALSGQPLLGTPVMVKPSEAEKNLVQSTASMTTGAGGISAVGARKLYVGNLHLSIREDQLRQVFEAFGTVELVQLPTDPQTGQCKGFGFVQFARLEDAKAAQNLNGQLEIAGRVIKVSAVTDQIGGQDIGLNTAGDIDDDDGGGLSLNASSRALLMQKLDRSGTASSFAGSFSSVAATGGIPMPVGPVIGSNPTVTSLVAPFGQVPGLLPGLPSNDSLGVPSECLLLKNMFDPKLETEPDFDLDIKEDVQDECSKFGTLKHIYVDKHSEGFVYLRFEIIPAAMSAQRALHGRWFAGKMITATYMTPETYEAQFPGSG